MKKHIFSLAYFPKLSEDYIKNRFLPFLKTHKEYIFDIYFTSLIPPFDDDGMGSAIEFKDTQKESLKILNFMLSIQKNLGIKVSATYNSIKVDPTAKNLKIFIENFKPLYEKGLRSITIPHYHWMASGILKREFPELFIKNTILRNVSRPQNYVDNAKAGFNLINIDRYNLRDRDNLKRLKKAYDIYKVPMSILVNEGCRGACPAMDEHFELNCSKDVKELYFNQLLAQSTCNLWKRTNPSYRLQTALMPPHREDFEEILEYVQVLKLHGRATFNSFEGSLEIIKRYANPNEKIIMPGLKKQFDMFNYDEKLLKVWRKTIKNCKFDCWDCSVCSELQKSAKTYELEFA